MRLSPLTCYHTGFPTCMHDLLEAKAFPDVEATGCRLPALMDPELQETSGVLGPGPHPAAHSLRASVSSDVTGNPHCLAHLGWEEYTGHEMVRDLGMVNQGPPAPIFPRKPKPRGAGDVGLHVRLCLGPQDSLADAHGALQRPQGPVWVGSERQEELEGPERMDFQTQWLSLHLELPHLSPLILAMAGAQVRGCHLAIAQS